MSNNQTFAQLVQELDVALAERRHLRQRGVHLIVTHLYHLHGTVCAAGERVGDIAIGGFPKPVSLGLTHMSQVLVDCFCRYHMPLSALRIEEIMNTDPFYINYATNRIGHNQVVSRPDRNSTRVYIGRIHKRMETVFRRLGLRLDPEQILTSETADSNVCIYQLRASVEFVHID